MIIKCEYGHETEYAEGMDLSKCPQEGCPSKKLTYIWGELKKDDKRSSVVGKETGYSKVTFQPKDRMQKLDEEYGNKW